jgi:asparagine synthase (glutamine-hydrolysing)
VRRKLGHTFLGRDNSVEALFLDLLRAAPDADSMDAAALPRMLYADRKTYLVELPMKQDQMSMACSIESACRSSITTSWSLR